MFTKNFTVDEKHVDFQGVVDGLYYPFYMEWTRHAFMKDELGLDLEQEFTEGRIHMILEYTMKFKKSLQKVMKCRSHAPLRKMKKEPYQLRSADISKWLSVRRGCICSNLPC